MQPVGGGDGQGLAGSALELFQFRLLALLPGFALGPLKIRLADLLDHVQNSISKCVAQLIRRGFGVL